MKANQRIMFIFSLLTIFLISFALNSWAQTPPPRPDLGGLNTNWSPPLKSSSGITTTDLNTLTPNDLVQALIGSGPYAPIISNVTYTGVNIAAGTFSGGTGIIGFEDGIILGSGNIASVVGPNQYDNVTTDNGLPGDPVLDGLIPGYQTFDATILEFDFECELLQVISFQYIFASDEYNEYVNSQFNDVFGFFLNGVNIALLPDNVTPVAINNVNCDNPYNPPNGSNCNLYINNDLSDGGGAIDTEMDGLTVVLTATAQVNPGVNHIKLAIADAGDHILDSDVFIKGESFVCAPPVIPVSLDIKPTSCPNPFNMGSKGVLPTAILGTEDFDVMTIDPASVRLEGIAPIRWEYKDVSRPVYPRYDSCDCTPDGGDGYMDLTLKFDHQAIASALGTVQPGEVIRVTLTAMTVDGIEIEGKDCIVIPPSLCMPYLISPLEGAIMDNGRTDRADSIVWDFDWSDCPEATQYHLYVKLPGAELPVIDNQSITSSSYHYDCPGCYISDENRLGWTWKVGVKIGDMWVRWTPTRTFDVEPVNTDPPPPPKLSADMPTEFNLGDAHPNPFNPETEISFSLPERSQASLVIYNILGEKVKILVDQSMEAGVHTVHWNGKDQAGNPVASGIYFYKLTAGDLFLAKKMVLTK